MPVDCSGVDSSAASPTHLRSLVMITSPPDADAPNSTSSRTPASGRASREGTPAQIGASVPVQIIQQRADFAARLRMM